MQTDIIRTIHELIEKFGWDVGSPYDPDECLPPHKYERGEMVWSRYAPKLIGYKNLLKAGIPYIIAATETKSAEKSLRTLLGLLYEYLNNPNVPELPCGISREMRGIIQVIFSYLPDEFIPGPEDNENVIAMPPELSTPEALILWEKAQKANLIDKKLQPLKLTKKEQALFAEMFADKLGIKNKWECFKQLWNVNYLAQYRYAAREITGKTGEREKEIEDLFK